MNEIEKIKRLYEMLSPCYLCPLRCGVERLKRESGICNSGIVTKISAFTLYKGEEPPLSGRDGSGTIFFSNCNLKCVYCQNFQFSQIGNGRFVSVKELTHIMLSLQEKGASNINLVTPTHYFPPIVASLRLAKSNGLTLPIILNTIGYEDVKVLNLLEGYIDIYLPDFRYIDDQKAIKYSQAPDYVNITTAAIKEMLKQVPEVKFRPNGTMSRGVIIRILLFPDNLQDLRLTLRHIAKEFGKDVYISLMSQYVPVYRAKEFPEISRKLSREEMLEAIKILREEGFKNGWVQYD